MNSAPGLNALPWKVKHQQKVDIKGKDRSMKHGQVNTPYLNDVINHADKGNSAPKPRSNKSETNHQNKVHLIQQAKQIIPFKFIGFSQLKISFNHLIFSFPLG